ncbi:MAG: ribosome silencing factor [Candidatus Omnitrophota bacterium]
MKLIASIAVDKKAEDLVILEMKGVTDFCDFFVILSAESHRQTQAIADGIEERLSKKKIKTYRRGADLEHSWIVLDFFDVVVHIFYKEVREFYNLEGLWADAKRIDLK